MKMGMLEISYGERERERERERGGKTIPFVRRSGKLHERVVISPHSPPTGKTTNFNHHY